MILLCDQWRVRTEDLQALLTTWHRDPGRIVVAQAGGKSMPPVIFPSRFFTQLRALTGDRGAHSLLHSHTGLMTAVPVENAAYDLDTQAHLELLRNTDL
jgi:molybdenum cofactor cytidylyltransferase